MTEVRIAPSLQTGEFEGTVKEEKRMKKRNTCAIGSIALHFLCTTDKKSEDRQRHQIISISMKTHLALRIEVIGW
jgi:hypothetical protein